MPNCESQQFLKEFSTLFEERKEQFISFAYSYTRDKQVSEDLFMDATIALWENRDHWEKESRLPALLLTILKRRCLNYLAHEQKKHEIGQDITDHYQRELNLRIATLQSCSPEKIFSEEIQNVVERTLNTLSEQSKKVFEMSRYDHMTNKEIAEELDLSVKTVEFHISKTLKQLRIALKDYLISILI